MSRTDTGLLVVDVQSRLIEHIQGHRTVVWNIRRLIDGAKALGLPVAATEQYPKGLGKTVEELQGLLGEIPSKMTFSCRSCGGIFEDWRSRSIKKVLVTGIETHVCVYQTVADLLAEGFRVEVVADACSSRTAENKQIGLERCRRAGAAVTSVEILLFELLKAAEGPLFKEILKIVK